MLLNYAMYWDVLTLQLLIGIAAELKQLREIDNGCKDSAIILRWTVYSDENKK